VIAAQVETAEPVIAAEAEPVPAPIAEAQPEPTPAPVPVVAAVPPAPVAVASAPATVHAPFVLPTEQLQSVAESAGLQWVNSDAEKIRAVQEAMAREPKPVHVPREPKPLEAVDEGPLVLVETRKDLSQIKLPFETAQGGSQPQA
jgi:ribonuclease E